MKSTVPKSIALSCLSLGSLLVTDLGVSIADALPSQEVITTYYSDSSKTTKVGLVMLLCDGHRGQWGVKTRYASQTSSPCNGGGPNPPSGPGSLPCEFLASGCSSFPNRGDGHYWQ